MMTPSLFDIQVNGFAGVGRTRGERLVLGTARDGQIEPVDFLDGFDAVGCG